MGNSSPCLKPPNKMSHFREDYEITAKPGARNLAYLSNPLQLHTDLPYYDYTTGVSIRIRYFHSAMTVFRQYFCTV